MDGGEGFTTETTRVGNGKAWETHNLWRFDCENSALRCERGEETMEKDG
jgi:hypothetical protein